MKSDFVIVAHKFNPQPDDELIKYLVNKGQNVVQVCHSFSDADNRKSWISQFFSDGKVIKRETKDYKNLPEVLIYVKEFFFTLSSLLKLKNRFKYYIAMDGLCLVYGYLLKVFHKVDKTIFWAMDYVPENRFGSKIKNIIYSNVNKFGYKNADQMWDISPRMAEAREKYAGIKRTQYKKHKIVPYGMWLSRIRQYEYKDCKKNTLVFMGHIIEKQGVQFVLEAIPNIIKIIPDFRFTIIGGGEYLDTLKNIAEKKGILRYCNFLGRIEKLEDVEKEIAKSTVAIAPYSKELDTWTYYADPGKVKTYLACGVPVLLTDIPWNAKEIAQVKAGEIITLDPNEMADAIVKLMDSKVNQQFRNNAIKYSKVFDYSMIFGELFKSM
ncbi:MAG TPA: glycosyltransferase [Bacilli bacterium]|nr:glycosyltransferase [Bacilli bacterium]